MTILLNEQREKVFLDRYAKKDKKSGKAVEETVEQMWDRVSCAISTSKKENDDFRALLDNFKFVPGGRILTGAGVDTEQTFYNCYVIPVEPKPSTLAVNPEVGNDSREAIFDTIATMVDIMSRGGGVGINWSVLRPSGSYLSRVSGSSSGPVGWMDVASHAVGEVEQGGSRRGAAMFMIDDWHPDIMKFVEAKRDFAKITNANVSVAVSDRFMQAVKDDAFWDLEFPDTNDPEYNRLWDGDLAKWKEAGRGYLRYAFVRAREIWDSITASAHASGEPGLVFLERYNTQSTGRHVERIISVNPCGEQGLGAYSVCNLGSMNLAAYINKVGVEGNSGYYSDFDWGTFSNDVATAVRFMDNVIDKSFYWDDRSRKRQEELRRIGLGVMGLADALIILGLRYGSAEAVMFTKNIFQMMKDTAIQTSMLLAEEKGPAKAYEDLVWRQPFLREFAGRYEKVGGPGSVRKPLRNLFFLTQAPTGTTSILAGVNSGIEPYFAFEYTRTDRTGTHKIYNNLLKEWEEKNPVNSVLPDYFVTSQQVTVEEHIAMQAAVQEYVDSSVSKTINAPNSHKIEDVDKAYRLAYDSGLKGIAYFRDGSGRAQVLSTVQPEATPVQDLGPELEAAYGRIAQLEEEVLIGPMADKYRRPALVTGQTLRLNTSMGTMYLTINNDEDGDPVEIFVNVGKAGSDVMAMGEAVGRLVSLGLQNGLGLSEISKQLVGVGGTSSYNPGLVHAIGKALDGYKPPVLKEVESVEEAVYEQADPPPPKETTRTGAVCPDCSQVSLVREEGCMKCYLCGYSAC